MITTFALSWLQRCSPIILFGFYYGFLATLPIGPAQMYYVRSILIQDKIIDRNNRIIPTRKLILSGSFVGQLIVFSSIYLCPIYTSIYKPHVMTLMFVPVFFFLLIRLFSFNLLLPGVNNPGIEFFLGVTLQLLNPALFSRSVYTRLVNMMLFRYSGNLLFLLSTAAGWLSGQILFVKVTKIFCSRVERDSPFNLAKKRRFFAFTFQVIFFGYFMVTCYGRNPAFFITKWNDQRSFLQGPLEEKPDETEEFSLKKKTSRKKINKFSFKKTASKKASKAISISSILNKIKRGMSLKDTKTDSVLSNFMIKPWPSIFFDYHRFNQPLRYVGIGKFILRGPVKSQVAEYFFDLCLSDGRQRISFTAPPSMSFFAKMVNLGDESPGLNQDDFDEWIVTKLERRYYLGEELEDRVRALSNGSPLVDVIEKRVRFSRTKSGEYLPEVHDPLLSGPFRGSMNQFKSPWMLPPDYSTEELQKHQQSQSKNDDSTNQLDRISFIRPENREKVVRPRNDKLNIILKWWLDKIRIFLLEEQEARTFLDEATLKNLFTIFDKIYPKDSLEYVLKILAPADLNRKIELEIASCDKKIFTNYLLNIFLQTTGMKWELLLNVLPTDQALLCERFFLMSSKKLPNSLVSMNVKKIPEEISDEDLPSEEEGTEQKNKNIFDEDIAYYKDFFVLYQQFMEFKENPIVNDYEPRIRDFNRFIVPKSPPAILSGNHDVTAVKDLLETRPKRARHLIIIKPVEKIKEIEDKEERKEKGFFKGFLKFFKDEDERTEEQQRAQEQEVDQEKEESKEGEDEENDLVTKDIHVFSFPYEGDFRRLLVKGAVRFQRRKVSVVNNWTLRPQSILFQRLKEMTQKPRRKPDPKAAKEKITISRLLRSFEKFVDRRQKRKEDQRRQLQQGFDWEVFHYLRAGVLYTHAYLRKRVYFPLLIIAKNVGRSLLFQVPEWEQDWYHLSKEFYLKCNYDGYELTDADVPKDWVKDYVKEGIQIKIVYPFRLRPWYESKPQSTDTDNKTTSFLSMYGTENELPFGNPAKVPSFWKPIGECIWHYTSHRAKAIIEWINPIIEWMKESMKPIRQWIELIELLCSEKMKVKMNKSELRSDTGSTENIQTNDKLPVMIRTRPTPNIKFSIEVVQDPLEPFSMQIEPDIDLEDPDDWTTTMNDRIKQMNEEYLFNLDIYKKLQADLKNKMDQPSPDIKSRLKKEWARIKIWGSIFQKKTTRFIRKKLPYFMKVLHFRVKLTLIDLNISILNLIESNKSTILNLIESILQFYMQLSQNIEATRKISISNRNRIINPIIKKNNRSEKISQAYVFHKIWLQIINMKGSFAKDLLKSRASSPLIKKDVKEFLYLQGILDCKEPQDLRVKDWKQWLKWCAGYRIAPHKKKNVIGNRLGWSEFASFLGEKHFASFLRRLKNRIKCHRYNLLAYSYLDHMKEDNHGPAVQYIPEPDHKIITKFQRRKKGSDYSKNKNQKDYDSSTTKENLYYKFQFWLFPDVRRRVKNAKRLDDLFPPEIIKKQIEYMWQFQEIEVAEDFDVDDFVIKSLKKKAEERKIKLAEERLLKEEREMKRKERQRRKEERIQKLELATTPKEVKKLKKIFKREDQQRRKEKQLKIKKKRKEQIQAKKAERIEKRAAQRAERAKREKERGIKKHKTRTNDFLVRDFKDLYHSKINMEKINTEKELLRIEIKNKILKLDAEKNSAADKSAWDEVKFQLDSAFNNKENQTEIQEEITQEENSQIEKEKKQRKEKRKEQKHEIENRKEQEEREMRRKIKKEKLEYREMAKNIRKWAIKYKLQKLPLGPWLSKGRNASRFLDKKKLGNKAAVSQLTKPYLQNGELDLELVEIILYLKSCFNKHDFFRIFGNERRRSMPLLSAYFNDRFLIYKIASLLLKLKKKGIDVNLFDRSERQKAIQDVNEKISSSLLFEDIFLPRRRREFRILNLLNLENNLDKNRGLSNSKEIENDEGFMEKDENLIIDTRQKIRRFLWPRYRLEDLICMNRYWWNTNNGSRSVMLRVRMYPKIDHWDHIQNIFFPIKHSFASIREILQDLGKRFCLLLGTKGTKHSLLFERNETMNEAKDTKMDSITSSQMDSFCSMNEAKDTKIDSITSSQMDSFCSISFSSGRSPSPWDEVIKKVLNFIRKLIKKLKKKFPFRSRKRLTFWQKTGKYVSKKWQKYIKPAFSYVCYPFYYVYSFSRNTFYYVYNKFCSILRYIGHSSLKSCPQPIIEMLPKRISEYLLISREYLKKLEEFAKLQKHLIQSKKHLIQWKKHQIQSKKHLIQSSKHLIQFCKSLIISSKIILKDLIQWLLSLLKLF
uniref:Protein TIC 214 n=2 Tax=Cunninghamia lanceolata TaxID=28977 RepID=A0A7R7DZ88_CUNLA|nr:hypothetical chloroplast RF1 [Cunninghamia lanceolata]AGL11002.1 hypothetical chloroplast RF1 [Cunninghamia lanceolata]BCK52192.1 hypothetical protein RF1 [Cunninghamia lanceolata var. konishii]